MNITMHQPQILKSNNIVYGYTNTSGHKMHDKVAILASTSTEHYFYNMRSSSED